MFSSLALVLTLCMGGEDHSAPPPNDVSELGQIIRFLNKHVVGRTFTSEKYVVKISGGKQEAEVEVSVTFADLAETRHGFYFDRATTRKQTNYDLDADGKRAGEKYVKDSQSVTRYFLGAQKHS